MGRVSFSTRGRESPPLVENPLGLGANTLNSKGATMPNKKTRKESTTTPRKTIEVDPALAGIDITEAIEWLNRRIAQYDHTNVDWFKIQPWHRGAWLRHGPPKRTAPRSRTFTTGHKSTAFIPENFPEFPLELKVATGSESHPNGTWKYTHTDVTIADANELTVYQVGCSVWAWLRRTKQEPGRRTNNGCRLNGIAWLKGYRNRVLPGMGRRAAIMATRAKIAACVAVD